MSADREILMLARVTAFLPVFVSAVGRVPPHSPNFQYIPLEAGRY